ncbi:MAG TPA: HlyD family efflux transporter periplasmic adaptor subunit [Pirellulaceae bacterium]|nr:HlyD family efflux transporter periplasmic adaptor subunit [Pirellulaceae bacterium]
MASGQVSSETIEKTKQQIRGLVGEIAQLAKSEMEPEEFYSAFLQRVVQALAAKGGAIWVLGEAKKPELAYQIDISPTLLDKESDEASKHFRLLDYIVATGTPQLVPPLSGAGDERMGGNPTRHLLVIHPLGHDSQVEGLVEIFQRSDTQPQTQRGYLQFMKQMCELTAEWFKNRKLRDLGDRHSLWSQADQFARQVHESLDVRETAYTIVNEGRRLMGCDRVTVGILKGGRCVVEAVSGQDTLDNRSNVVTLLGKLATRVVASGEPLWYAGATDDMPPQIEEAIEEYVDQSYTKSLAVIPLRQPKPTEAAQQQQQQQPGGEGTPVENAHTGQIVGALIIEQIESEIPRDVLAPRLDLVYEHSARALTNALDHNSLFLMPVWRTIGKSRWLVRGRQLPKTVLIAGGLLVLLVAGLAIPGDFDMRAKGTLQPVVRQDLFAPSAGDVIGVLKGSGDTVQAGETVIQLHNAELKLKLNEVEGRLSGSLAQYQSIDKQLLNSQAMTAAEKLKIQADQANLTIQLQSLRDQLALLKKREEQLTIKSPIAGRVTTWDAKRLLQNRPVETGQVLMTIAAEDTAYELEINMPERHMDHVRRAREVLKRSDPNADLGVDFILMTDPGQNHTGKVVHINPTAEPHEDQGNIVRIRVQPDQELTSPRPGATVTADVHCGRAPLLWTKLHQAWEWVEANLLF